MKIKTNEDLWKKSGFFIKFMIIRSLMMNELNTFKDKVMLKKIKKGKQWLRNGRSNENNYDDLIFHKNNILKGGKKIIKNKIKIMITSDRRTSLQKKIKSKKKGFKIKIFLAKIFLKILNILLIILSYKNLLNKR